MGRFTKRPVTVEAVQFNKIGDHPADEAGFGTGFCIEGRQGFVGVDPGDWIITEMNGAGFYPCKPDVFEATYEPTQVLGASAMSFGDALRALKAGERVCRAGWNGKSMWLALTPGSTVPATAAKRTGALLAYVEAEGVEEVEILPHIDMRGADGRLTIGWAPSQPDMLAQDWMVLPGEPAQAA